MRSTSSIARAPECWLARGVSADERRRDRVVAANLVRGAVGEDRPLVHDHNAFGIREKDIMLCLEVNHGMASGAEVVAEEFLDGGFLLGEEALVRLVGKGRLGFRAIGEGSVGWFW